MAAFASELRRVADEILHRLQSIPDTGRSYVVGGRPRQLRVLLDPVRLAFRQVAILEVLQVVGSYAKSIDELTVCIVGHSRCPPSIFNDSRS